MSTYVSYLRVSTGKQSLGLSAQKSTVQSFLRTGNRSKLIAEFRETESGTRRDRPQLNAAIALCRKHKATLLIARLDRLARNAAFVLSLRDAGVDFVACDMPTANRLTITILAAVAEQERDWISERTRAGLAEARKRGTKLGNPMKPAARKKAIATNQRKAQEFARALGPIIREIRDAGVTTLKGIAQCLNARGFKTPHGRAFTRQIVARTLRRVQ